MTLSQIMYFLAVVKYKTFTQASDELYISQSSLSKQIKALELELGHTLFNREAKENTLTAEGERFLVYEMCIRDSPTPAPPNRPTFPPFV